MRTKECILEWNLFDNNQVILSLKEKEQYIKMTTFSILEYEFKKDIVGADNLKFSCGLKLISKNNENSFHFQNITENNLQEFMENLKKYLLTKKQLDMTIKKVKK